MKAENNEQERMLYCGCDENRRFPDGITQERNAGFHAELRIERQIDAALSSYPVAPLPSDFTSQVMARVALTTQELGPATPLVAHTTLRRYLRLYSFELICSTLLTLGLGIGIAWPLFAQTGLLPVLWSGAPAMNIQIETLITHYFSPWYVVGIGVVILLELAIALLAWMMWMEQPQLKVR